MWLYADIQSVPDILRHYARALPDKQALLCGSFTRTFRELDEFTSRVARALVTAGVRENDVVAFLGKNSIAFFDVLFGASKAGATVLPMNWRLPATELGPIADDCSPVLAFVDKEFLPVIEQVNAGRAEPIKVIPVDSIASADGGLEAWVKDSPALDPMLPGDPRNTAFLIYTSGTTGYPKGVEISHQSLNYMRLCEHLEPTLQWHADDVLMMIMPNFHLLGTALPIQSLYNGCTVSIMPVMEPGKLIELIGATRPTILVLAPTAIQMVLDHPTAKTADFSSLRLVMYASSPINAQLLKRGLIEMKCHFMQFYGATESCGAMTILRPEEHDLVNEERLKSCGRPLPLIDFRIVDAAGNELPDGEIGEFHCRTPAMFSGYLHQPQTTAAVLDDGWYRTGDAGYRDPADGLLYLVDRVKDMIVTGGENVYSAEVEQVVQKHPAVSSCAVVGAPDSYWGERVVAVVVLKQGAVATEEEIIAFCRGQIAGYKIPKQVRIAPTLPLSNTGKILKRVLRETLTQP
ncbi:MAG: long-chain-fatty-acid--CoA ligase [Rudaea sp.]|uniref:long-chain-fatty-acid--CoA ligase n=1 Tax=Rudaea sp. TaxID=2136325 RepID=UPI0039E52298